MIDWPNVRRVLVVRLRSIGDTVLATPSLVALKRFLPHARVDVLLEDWVAPLLDGFDLVDDVITVGGGTKERLKTAWILRRNRYDVVINLHGGTTSTFLARAAGAKHRVGYSHYQYSFLYNHRLSSSSEFWRVSATHSAEQQLALLGHVGVPVADRPRSQLTVTADALETVRERLEMLASPPRDAAEFVFENGSFQRPKERPVPAQKQELFPDFALIHPAAAFATKQWSPLKFGRIAEYLAARGLRRVAVASHVETGVLQSLKTASRVPIETYDDLSLPELTALASRAAIFIGNDSGIAHIAAAVGTPTVVVFGSSNREHWRPWTDAPNEIVFEEFECQPCDGYECKKYGEPRCILSVTPEKVISAIDHVLAQNVKGR